MGCMASHALAANIYFAPGRQTLHFICQCHKIYHMIASDRTKTKHVNVIELPSFLTSLVHLCCIVGGFSEDTSVTVTILQFTMHVCVFVCIHLHACPRTNLPFLLNLF